uniref:GNAT family N-acetyltransferase n=1 Tax=Acetatifactor sp. TaxID=1872090 RepID=UPI00405792AA
MTYQFSKNIRDDETLRQSFNALTQKTFGFDFEGWYQAGGWGDLYIPHVLMDGDKIVSNVSVNIMNFVVDGIVKKYIQLGTVMTDGDYRGQGLNRRIMEQILEEYAGRVDGIYLFGNDSVVEYYPQFGFKSAKEYEYYMTSEAWQDALSYQVVSVDMEDESQSNKLYAKIIACASAEVPNSNDALYMHENLGLYQFWMAAEYGESVFYLPEQDAYVIAESQEDRLHIVQIISGEGLDVKRLAKSLGTEAVEVVLGFTPIQKDDFQMREHKEEDSTLFILGEDLERMEREQMMFPIFSHA